MVFISARDRAGNDLPEVQTQTLREWLASELAVASAGFAPQAFAFPVLEYHESLSPSHGRRYFTRKTVSASPNRNRDVACRLPALISLLWQSGRSFLHTPHYSSKTVLLFTGSSLWQRIFLCFELFSISFQALGVRSFDSMLREFRYRCFSLGEAQIIHLSLQQGHFPSYYLQLLWFVVNAALTL